MGEIEMKEKRKRIKKPDSVLSESWRFFKIEFTFFFLNTFLSFTL